MQKKDLKTGMLVKAKSEGGVFNIYKVFKEGQFRNQALMVRERGQYLTLSHYSEDLAHYPEDLVGKTSFFEIIEIREPSYPAPTAEQFKHTTREDLREEFSRAKIFWPKSVAPVNLTKDIEEVFKLFEEVINNKP